MTTDDQQLLNQISLLAGQINRHKNGQAVTGQMQSSNSGHGGYFRPSASWHYHRGGYSRGGRGGGNSAVGQVHRNRSLVLPATAASSKPPNANSSILRTPVETQHSYEKKEPVITGNEWISKTDRHRQLINASIFEKTVQDRAKAIEETRKYKSKQRHAREKYMLQKYFQQQKAGSHHMESSMQTYRGTNTNTGTSEYEVNVQGMRFLVAKSGSKLIRVPGDINSAKIAPKVAHIGSVKFYRSRSGNMYRSGIIKAHRAMGMVTKVKEACKLFSTTGSCQKGPRCRYIHDASKVAVCKEYLLKGTCLNGEVCDLSHELTPERTPSCVHFARGNCSKPDCRYIHVRVSPAAQVCRGFAILGYCEKGTACMERHINECPDFSNTGKCLTRGCKLTHREKASLMRTKDARGKSEAIMDLDGEPDGISEDYSDDEDIGSDDVDSEGFDEFLDDEVSDTEIPMQQDYVHLS